MILDRFMSTSVAEKSLYGTLFDRMKFFSFLKTSYVGRNFVYFEETDSTMNVAQKLLEENPNISSGTLILSEKQTHGRGRENRMWTSFPKGNLYFTLIFRPCDINELRKLNLATCCAVVKVCRDKDVKAGVKWPNDVWVNGKKICGMLIDSSITGSSLVANVGVGININEEMRASPFREISESATSLFEVLGKPLDREEILGNFCNQMESMLSFSFQDVLKLYISYDILIGKRIIVMPKKKEDPERLEADAIGFSEYGNLIVQYRNSFPMIESGNLPKELIAEEVSIRPESL